MTGEPIDAKNPEFSVVNVEANSDEYITAENKASKIKETNDEEEMYI